MLVLMDARTFQHPILIELPQTDWNSQNETINLRKFVEKSYDVRHKDLKLVIKKDGTPQLYNLTKDIGEQNDIAQQYPDKVKKLEAIRKEWDSQLIEPIFNGLIMSKERKKKKTIKSN